MKKILISSILAGMVLFSGCGDGDVDDGITPQISLLGDLNIEILVGGSIPSAHITPNVGYTAYDEQDGDLTSQVTVNSNINYNQLGSYKITYSVQDSDGYTDSEERNVTIVSRLDNGGNQGGGNQGGGTIGTLPNIYVTSDVYLSRGESYSPSYSAYDAEDGTLTNLVTTDAPSQLDIHTDGNYIVTFWVTDSHENTVSESQTVHVGNFDIDEYDSTPLGQFKTWYSDVCGQSTDNVDSRYNASTQAYNGTITCANQDLYNIDLSTLSMFKTINGLDLSGNNLRDIDFTQLDLLPNNTKILVSLDLRDNQLSTSNFDLFRPLFSLYNIDRLYIEGNNFNYTQDDLYILRTEIFNNNSLTIDIENL